MFRTINRSTFFFIMFLLVFCLQPKQSRGQEVTGKWYGTMSMEIISTSELGNSATRVYLTISENVVTGSVESSSRVVVEGKEVGRSSCTGAGEGKLWRVAFSSDGKTYDLQAISPVYTCTHNNYILGTTEVEKMDNGLDLIVDRHPMGVSGDALSGTKTETGDIAGIGRSTTTITWSLSSKPISAELIVTPEDYDDWLPEPGRDELTKGSAMKINLELRSTNGQPLSLRAKNFELTLTNTSREPGITINYPVTPGANQLPDLRFLPMGVGESIIPDQFLSIPCHDGSTGKASIGSYDGGGFTTLTAVAILEDNTRLEGHLLISGGNTQIPIPKRPAGSDIGIAWLVAHNNPGDGNDIETSIGNTNIGDGLTAYEEYRGVILAGGFRRLNPHKKELGVWGKRTDMALFPDGFAWFENASGIKVLRFDETEIGTNKRLNKNVSTSHSYDQFVLKIEKNSLPDGEFGKTFGGPGIPSGISKTIIDIDQATRKYQNTVRYYNTLNIPVPYTLAEFVAKTVAHELGHGVNIKHHGPNGSPINLNITVSVPNPAMHVYLPTGAELTDPHYHLLGSAGNAGEQASGDINCMMNYLPGYDYSAKDINGVLYFYIVPDDLHIGRIFCTSQAGTGINTRPNYFGNAPEGNCLSQIKLK